MQKSLSLLAVLVSLSACGDVEVQSPPQYGTPVAAPQPQPAPQPMVDWSGKAKFAELSGDYVGAANIYATALQSQPTNREFQYALAENYRRIGEYDRAFAIYADILKAEPGALAAKEGGAMTLVSKGDYDTPINLLDEVIKADPRRVKALNGMGVLFTTRNLQGDAQQYFNEALKYAPNDAVVLTNLGLSKALEGKYADAASAISTASSVTVLGSYDRKRADMNLALVRAASGSAADALAIASAYYAGPEYNATLGIFAKIASDKKLAKTYLHAALTDGKAYYQDWAPAPKAAM
jgi:Flp pilus assembly protein TadD